MEVGSKARQRLLWRRGVVSIFCPQQLEPLAVPVMDTLSTRYASKTVVALVLPKGPQEAKRGSPVNVIVMS